MKFAFVAIGLAAAVVNASSDGHRHFRRSNGTEPQTTMTVTATQVHTVISCAPTVTNCPADAKDVSKLPESQRATAVVTDTVVLTTTVCPVASAAGLSASLVSSHSAGKITGSTLAPSPAVTLAQAVTTATSDIVSDSPVTLTSGSEVITTTIRSTKKTTITITMTAGHGNAASVEPTTTVTETGTRTVTVTLKPAAKTGISYNKSEDDDAGSDSASGSASGESCDSQSPVTVTVTAAPSTVTLPATTVYVTKDNNIVNEAAVASSASDEDEDCSTDSFVTVKHTVTVIPYATGNSTPTPTPTPGVQARASGFARVRR